MKNLISNPYRSHTFFTAAFAVVLLTHFAVHSALAATKTWVGGHTSTETWHQATQWSVGAFANVGDVIFINTTGTSSPSTFLTSGQTVKSITFNGGIPSPAFNITLATSENGGAASTLTIDRQITGDTSISGGTLRCGVGNSASSEVGLDRH